MLLLTHKASKPPVNPSKEALMVVKRLKVVNATFLLIPTIGNLLGVVVHAGNIHDTKAGILVVNKVMKIYPSIQAISADAGYRKTFEKDVLDNYDIPVDISTKINGEWKIIPKRWIVERNFAWMNNFRRLTKDFEITVKSAESFVKIAHIAQMLRNLCL